MANNSPSPKPSSGAGVISLPIAAQTMAIAAAKIKAPSKPLAKYSILSCPKECSSSGGWAAISTALSAASAAARFTRDSSASESRLTDPVTRQATSFRTSVATAAATESQA